VVVNAYNKIKMTKTVSYGGLVAIGIATLAYFYSENTSLNKLGEAVSERFCEHVSRTNQEPPTVLESNQTFSKGKRWVFHAYYKLCIHSNKQKNKFQTQSSM